MWVALLTTKYAIVDAVKHLQAMAEKKSGRKLRALHTNNGREFTITKFVAYLQRRTLSAIIAPPTRRSRTTSWRGETRWWLPWRGLC
jgi:hypothetical protein